MVVMDDAWMIKLMTPIAWTLYILQRVVSVVKPRLRALFDQRTMTKALWLFAILSYEERTDRSWKRFRTSYTRGEGGEKESIGDHRRGEHSRGEHSRREKRREEERRGEERRGEERR